MAEPRHGNPEPWQQHQQPGQQPYGQQQPYQPVVAPPKRPNHILHLILTLLTCGAWASVWIVLTARYWNVIDYRNPRERSGMDRRTAIAIAVIIAVGVVGGVATASSDTGTTDLTTAASDTSTTAAAITQDEADSTGPLDTAEETEAAEKTPAAKPVKPKAKPPTVAQEEAMEAAQSYVDMTGFSRAGLLEQLTSSAGSGFEKADAVYAVNRINVDWNAEAVESAKSYLELTSFSRSGLIEQLTSKAGSEFTMKQAKYAVNKVGL